MNAVMTLRLRDRARAFGKIVRTIIGAPDYDRYLEHHATCHPGQQPLTREEFARERLQARYNTPGNRCC